MKKYPLVGLAGKARSGKDTAGGYLKDAWKFGLYAFADPLKKACSEMFGVNLEYFYDDFLKEQILPFWGYSPRQMAQLLGTEGGRKLFREDIWVRRAEAEMSKLGFGEYEYGMVITDVRFENEADLIRSNGGTVVHIIRPEATGDVGVSGHASEQGIVIEEYDKVVYNDSTLLKFYNRLDGIADEILR